MVDIFDVSKPLRPPDSVGSAASNADQLSFYRPRTADQLQRGEEGGPALRVDRSPGDASLSDLRSLLRIQQACTEELARGGIMIVVVRRSS